MFKRNNRSFSGILGQLKLVLSLMRDSEVPAYLKLIPVAVAAYLISPVDLLPEIVAGPLGMTDDAFAVLMGLDLFIKLIPKHVISRYTGDEDIVDGTYTSEASSDKLS